MSDDKRITFLFAGVSKSFSSVSICIEFHYLPHDFYGVDEAGDEHGQSAVSQVWLRLSSNDVGVETRGLVVEHAIDCGECTEGNCLREVVKESEGGGLSRVKKTGFTGDGDDVAVHNVLEHYEKVASVKDVDGDVVGWLVSIRSELAGRDEARAYLTHVAETGGHLGAGNGGAQRFIPCEQGAQCCSAISSGLLPARGFDAALWRLIVITLSDEDGAAAAGPLPLLALGVIGSMSIAAWNSGGGRDGGVCGVVHCCRRGKSGKTEANQEVSTWSYGPCTQGIRVKSHDFYKKL